MVMLRSKLLLVIIVATCKLGSRFPNFWWFLPPAYRSHDSACAMAIFVYITGLNNNGGNISNSELRHFVFVTLLDLGKPGNMQNFPKRGGVWPRSRDPNNFRHTIEFKTTRAKDFKFGTQLHLG